VDEADNSVTARRTLIVIGLVLATLATLFLAYETRRVLTWIVISVFFAVALHPAVTWVTRRVAFGRRWFGTLLVFVVVFALLGGLITLFVVPLVNEGSQVARNFPQILEDARNGRGPVGGLIERFHLLQYAQDNADKIRGYASGLGAPTLAFLTGVATTIAGVVTIFVLSYLMVLEGPQAVDGLLSLFDDRHAERIRRVGHDCAKTVTGYISGNLIISVVCGVLTYAVLALVGVPYAGLIALFVALADLIPLVGATLGAVVASLAAFTQSVTAGIITVVFFIVYQQVENHLLQPVVFSRTVKLNPLTVLIAILIAVELAGILGALLSIPIAGILQILVRDTWDARHGRPKPEPTVGEDETPVNSGDGAGDGDGKDSAAAAGISPSTTAEISPSTTAGTSPVRDGGRPGRGRSWLPGSAPER
jgi:predicted PurR-regulated permease PerM